MKRGMMWILGTWLLLAGGAAGAYSLNFQENPELGSPVLEADFDAEPEAALAQVDVRHAEVNGAALEILADGLREWKEVLTTRPGLLKTAGRYRIRMVYTFLAPVEGDSYAYVLVRKSGKGFRHRPLPVLEEAVGERREIVYDFFTGEESDCITGLGVHGNAHLTVHSLTVEELPRETVLDQLSPGEGEWRDVAGVCVHFEWRYHYTDEQQIVTGLDAVKELGVGWIRLVFPWDQLFPENGEEMDPGMRQRLNFIVDEATKRDLEVLAILIAPPHWASTGPDAETAWRYPARHLEDWASYVKAMGGEFRGRITDWEIGNEPNWDVFWMGTMDQYLAELKAASTVLRALDPNNRILSGGLSDAGLYGMKNSNRNSLAALLTPEAIATYDVLSLHLYPAVPEEAVYAVQNVQGLMAERGVVKPIWITETGFSMFGKRNLEQQAEVHENLLPDLLAVPGVEKLFIYNLRQKGFVEDDYERGFGLLTDDLQPRPVYHRLKALLGTSPPAKVRELRR